MILVIFAFIVQRRLRLFDRNFAVNLRIHAAGIGVVFMLVNRGMGKLF
jgi:hypothetical protein